MRSKRTRVKTIIDLRRFFILVLSNRCCSTDIKINTTFIRIGVVAQIQKLILHELESTL